MTDTRAGDSQPARISLSDALRIAEAVRAACLDAALEAYESAQFDGLCEEGALEVALGAVRGLDLAPLVDKVRLSPDVP